jgi:hypothetical protein
VFSECDVTHTPNLFEWLLRKANQYVNVFIETVPCIIHRNVGIGATLSIRIFVPKFALG